MIVHILYMCAVIGQSQEVFRPTSNTVHTVSFMVEKNL